MFLFFHPANMMILREKQVDKRTFKVEKQFFACKNDSFNI